MVEIDFTDVQEFKDVPAGRYHVAVTDYAMRETSDESKFPNNPYWNLVLTVQEGEYAGQNIFDKAMLPPYKPYTLQNILIASGKYAKEELDSNPPDLEPEDLLGLEFEVVWGKQKDSDFMEVKRYYSTGSEDNSLLPE